VSAKSYTPSEAEVREAVAEWMWSRRMWREEVARADGAELDRFLAALSSPPADDVREALDLDVLEAKARAATPGPWMLDGMGKDEPEVNYWAHRFIGALDGPDIIATSEDGHGPNAEYIAAASPDVVLALIDRVRAIAVRPRGTVTDAERRSFPEAARGDGPCMDCGTLDTPVWFTDNVTWNLCPVCFIARAHEAGLRPVSWRIYPEFPRRYAAKAREDRS
jgi:hypothetical protein